MASVPLKLAALLRSQSASARRGSLRSFSITASGADLPDNRARCFPSLASARITAPSFAGMYIVDLAASDSRIAGAIAQSPLVDGVAAARLASPLRGLRLLSVALA